MTTVIYETKWHIWLFCNDCKHTVELQNINEYKYSLKYQLRFLLTRRQSLSKFQNMIDENSVSTL